MGKKTKTFSLWGKEGQDRRRRIKESRDVVVCFRYMYASSKFFDGQLVPPSEFKAEDYPNALYTNIYGDMYLVIPNCDVSKADFIEMFRNKDLFIAKKYEDLDGTIAQTKFKLY